MTAPIKKAVFPVAGLGTRFLPATKATPKEMMPVVDKPLIQYAVEEAYAAGITEMIFVTGRHKRAIEDHFDTAYELERELEAANKSALLEVVRNVKPADVQCVFVRQPVANGLVPRCPANAGHRVCRCLVSSWWLVPTCRRGRRGHVGSRPHQRNALPQLGRPILISPQRRNANVHVTHAA